MYVYFFFALCFVVLMFILITQVFIPAIRGTQFFPLVNKSKTSEAIHEAESALEQISEAELLKSIEKTLVNRANNLKD